MDKDLKYKLISSLSVIEIVKGENNMTENHV